MTAYATLADLKEWLSIPPATTTNDALLTKLLNAATAFMDTYMEREDVRASARTEARDGNGNRRLMVKHWPVTAVSSVEINGQAVPASASWAVNGYVFDKNSITLRGLVFEDGVQNVQLAYTAGYTVVPDDLNQACIELAGFKYRTRDTTASGFQSKSLAGETISFSQKDMSTSVKSVLNEYRAVFAV